MNGELLSPEEALPRMTELLQSGKDCRLVVTGRSMLPFLRHKTDAVILTAFVPPAKKNEIVFYRRPDGTCVLHRVFRIEKDGTLFVCGDAQTALEPILPEQILARVTNIEKKGKIISCRDIWLRIAIWVWQRLIFCRPFLLKNMLRFRRLLKKTRKK